MHDKSGHSKNINDSYKYIWKNEKIQVLKMTMLHMFGTYTVFMVILYKQTKLYNTMSKFSIAKESLKVIINQLNEAIILKNADGTLGFCNEIGIQLLKPANLTSDNQSEHNTGCYF